MKEKVDIEIASECNNDIKSSDQIKNLSWSLSPVMNCLYTVVSDTWSRAAWDQQKDFHLLKWPLAHMPLQDCSHLMLQISLLHKITERKMCKDVGQGKKKKKDNWYVCIFPGVFSHYLSSTTAFWVDGQQIGKGLHFLLLLPFPLVTSLAGAEQDAFVLAWVLAYTKWWGCMHVPLHAVGPVTFSTLFSLHLQTCNKVVPEPIPSVLIPWGMGEPVIGGFAGKHWSSVLSSKQFSIALFILGTVESKTA